MEDLQKRPPSSPEEEAREKTMEVVYKAAFKSAKEQGIIADGVSLKEFKEMKLRDVLTKLKEKGIDHFEIQL